MIAEFTIIPIGSGESLSPFVAECLKIVKASGLRYELTATCTIIEGEYDEVMRVIGECHKKVRSMSRRVVTSIRIDDREGESNAIERKVRSVEEKAA
jgi:uncharacterized protein (TIGR00106 family)